MVACLLLAVKTMLSQSFTVSRHQKSLFTTSIELKLAMKDIEKMKPETYISLNNCQVFLYFLVHPKAFRYVASSNSCFSYFCPQIVMKLPSNYLEAEC